MKLERLLLRWYKSFNVNYNTTFDDERRQGIKDRPWNAIKIAVEQDGHSTNVDGAAFPFIEIPLENGITTIVGANESGKSHLLKAMQKILLGSDLESGEVFSRTDLCRYSSIDDPNARLCPQIGLTFRCSDREVDLIGELLGRQRDPVDQSASKQEFTLDEEADQPGLSDDGTTVPEDQHQETERPTDRDAEETAPSIDTQDSPPNNSAGAGSTWEFCVVLGVTSDDDDGALAFFNEGGPVYLSSESLAELRTTYFPEVKYIRSKIALSDQVSLADLIWKYRQPANATESQRQVAQLRPEVLWQAVEGLTQLSIPEPAPNSPNTQVSTVVASSIKKALESLNNARETFKEEVGSLDLELLLFRDILGIELDALERIAEEAVRARGYVDGKAQEWNALIEKKLNLARYWEQDDEFTLQINHKEGTLYFEITDRTGSIYTFKERSGGLKYFLSYYIQAKALEGSSARGSLILMDEPDSFLSILGQKNLLAVFEALVGTEVSSGKTQLVYTTHSPFLINRNFPRRIRLVRKGDLEEGTQYVQRSRTRRYEPVRSALGIDCANTLFLGRINLILEGATDQFIVTELIRYFRAQRDAPQLLDLNSLTLVSPEGSGIPRLVKTVQAGDEKVPAIVVLVDDDGGGENTRKCLVGESKRSETLLAEDFVVKISEACGAERLRKRRIVTTEDLFPIRAYLCAAREFLEEWGIVNLVPDSELEQLSAAIAEREEPETPNGVIQYLRKLLPTAFGAEGRSLDKMGISLKVIEALEAGRLDQTDEDELFHRLVKLCETLSDRIDRAERESNKRSGKQIIGRVVNDHLKSHVNSCSTHSLLRLLRRVESDLDLLGQDAEALAQIILRLRRSAEEYRQKGVLDLTEDLWGLWRSDLKKIMKNPLSPEPLEVLEHHDL